MLFPVSDVIPSRTTPYVTIGLIAVNAIVFVYVLQLGPLALRDLSRQTGVIPSELSLASLFTSTVVHGGWIHFGVNILYLWLFGENVEDAIGHAGFALFYLLSGALTGLAHAALHSASWVPFIGASGAVASVMGAYFVLYPRSRVLTAAFVGISVDVLEVPAVFFLGLWLLVQLAINAAGTGTAAGTAGAYAAGFATGMVIGFACRHRARLWDARP